MEFTFSPIAVVRSCFKEKFGIPRQPGLIPEACGVIELLAPYDREASIRGLESFSHLWLIFVFHANPPRRPRSTVRPPRLGGNRRMGVFATRSGFRPNPIGMSVVEMTEIETGPDGVRIHVKGLDLLDGTPVLDLKPYLPYADRVVEATSSLAAAAPSSRVHVSFTPAAEAFCREYQGSTGVPLAELVVRMLSADPRPAYVRGSSRRRSHGVRLMDLDVRWEVLEGGFLVSEILRSMDRDPPGCRGR
ncbi:MAG: tRNA (N6-threonylcarbamoyladenosine(37)-N6)-methyltransferase TrmO [Desulfobacterales bacterium]